jgi:hypothetical protein
LVRRWLKEPVLCCSRLQRPCRFVETICTAGRPNEMAVAAVVADRTTRTARPYQVNQPGTARATGGSRRRAGSVPGRRRTVRPAAKGHSARRDGTPRRSQRHADADFPARPRPRASISPATFAQAMSRPRPRRDERVNYRPVAEQPFAQRRQPWRSDVVDRARRDHALVNPCWSSARLQGDTEAQSSDASSYQPRPSSGCAPAA